MVRPPPHRVLLAITMLIAGAAAGARGEELVSGQLAIRGAVLRVSPERQDIDPGRPTVVHTTLGDLRPDQTPSGLQVVGDLSGPGLELPLRLRTAPGDPSRIPGLNCEGSYTLSGIRLLDGERTVAPAVQSLPLKGSTGSGPFANAKDPARAASIASSVMMPFPVQRRQGLHPCRPAVARAAAPHAAHRVTVDLGGVRMSIAKPPPQREPADIGSRGNARGGQGCSWHFFSGIHKSEDWHRCDAGLTIPTTRGISLDSL
jgi:hypothetical protein